MRISLSSSLESGIPKEGSWIIISHASYEPRCLDFLSLFVDDFDVVDVYIVYSEDRLGHEGYIQNIRAIERTVLQKKNLVVKSIPAERFNPIKAVNLLHQYLSEGNNIHRNILIDVTTFTRDRLSCFICYFWRIRAKTPELYFSYTPPANFNTEQRDGWLTKGVRKITSIPGFNGRQKIHKKMLLVLLLGHESERALTTVINREPDSVLLIEQGDTQVTDSIKLSADKHAKILTSYLHTELLPGKSVSYNDPVRTHGILKEIVNEYSEQYNISVLAGGSKLQMLGLIWACLEFPEIELIYSSPKDYNTVAFSSGCGKKTYGLLDFSD